MAAMSFNSPQLDYAPRPGITRRRWPRRTIIVIIILAAMPLAWHWTLAGLHLARIRDLYRQCATYTASPDHIVFSDIADDGINGHVTPPICWVDLNSEAGNTQILSSGTVFLHELRTITGQRRLIGIDLQRDQFRGNAFTTRIYAPPSPLGMPAKIGVANGSPLFFSYTTRAYAGQIDPADPSHFTLSLTVDGQSRTLDGWLKDDSTVALEERRNNP